MSWGPNLLVKQGAKLVQEWNDVLVELPADIRRALIAKAQARCGQISLETNSEDAAGHGEIGPAGRSLLAQLKHDLPIHIDQLIETFDTLTPSEIVAGLFELELLGMVRQLPGKNFVKVW
jgi:DNA processing protein